MRPSSPLGFGAEKPRRGSLSKRYHLGQEVLPGKAASSLTKSIVATLVKKSDLSVKLFQVTLLGKKYVSANQNSALHYQIFFFRILLGSSCMCE